MCYGHSCDKVLQRNLLLEKINANGLQILNQWHGLANGALVLPRSDIFDPPDSLALEVIRNAVRIERGLAMTHEQRDIARLAISVRQINANVLLPPPPPPEAAPPRIVEREPNHQQYPDFLIDDMTQLPDSNISLI